jgi:prepilin-type N-terminal cleavage/methylation domain-containing protein
LNKSEDAFTLVELSVVVVLIGLLVGVTVIVWQATARRMDLQAAAEMLKEDIRRVYALADSGVARPGSDGLQHRDRYILEINTNGGAPPNCYRVRVQKWSGTGYGIPGPPDNPQLKQAANKVVGDGWIQPSFSSDTVIQSVSGAGSANPYSVTFVSKGSIVQTLAPGDVIITIRSLSKNKDINITISLFGSVSQ